MNLKKTLRVFLPEHKAVVTDREAFMQAVLEQAEEEAKDYLDSLGLSEEQRAMIDGVLTEWLNTNVHGRTVKTINMPTVKTVVVGALLSSGQITMKQVAIYNDKVAIFIRADDRFHVRKGRGAAGNGGISILARLSDKERADLLGDDTLAAAAE